MALTDEIFSMDEAERRMEFEKGRILYSRYNLILNLLVAI